MISYKTFLLTILLAFNNGIIICGLDSKIFIKEISWVHPHSTFLFAPGLWTSEIQAAKYCKEYLATNGQVVKAGSDFEVMRGATCKACNFAELQLVDHSRLQTFYKNGLPFAPRSVLWSFLYRLAEAQIAKSNNYYDVSLHGESHNGLLLTTYLINLFNLNFGQAHDVKIFSGLYDKACEDKELPEDIVLFGTSRGAATIINFMALEYFKKPQRVKALVLEGCFDSLHNLLLLVV